jgi:hypothetical protein
MMMGEICVGEERPVKLATITATDSMTFLNTTTMSNNSLSLVTFEQANRLKAAGFDWNVEYCYYTDEKVHRSSKRNHNRGNDEWSAPTVALAIKWMRDVKGIPCGVVPCDTTGNYIAIIFDDDDKSPITLSCYQYYEATESALLDELLNLIENE